MALKIAQGYQNKIDAQKGAQIIFSGDMNF